MSANNVILSLTAVAALMIGSIGFGLAQRSNSERAPGEQMQERGSTPSQPGVSGYTRSGSGAAKKVTETEELRGGMPPMHNKNSKMDNDVDDN